MDAFCPVLVVCVDWEARTIIALMIARAELVDRGNEPREDHYVHLYGVTWADYLRLLQIRGDRSAPRITYIEGTLEIMSPSRTHDEIKSYIGRLVEAWCLERGIEFTPYGSWTLKNKREERGAEADECYVFGPDPSTKRRPDVAIEVVWTSGGIDKLEVYRKLGVREVWFYERGTLRFFVLRDETYAQSERSEVLPSFDPVLLVRAMAEATQSAAVRVLRASLRSAQP